MTEFPHMPLAIDAYVLKTTHLTLEQHGAYMLLLITAWRASGEPRLPNDDKYLARALGVTMKKWLTLKPAVMSFWQLGEDGWTQKKQLEVRRAVAKKLEQKRGAANARWGAKSLEDNEATDADAYAADHAADILTINQTLSTNENTRPNGLVSEPEVADANTRKRISYPADFDASWSAYPTDANMSKLKAFAAWKRLSPGDRASVATAIPAFLAFCRKDPTYRPVHMVRFITERRFDGLLGDGRATLATAGDWQRRLDFGRSRQSWSTAEWGPAPGLPGSLAPKEMIRPGDGDGWVEWKAAS